MVIQRINSKPFCCQLCKCPNHYYHDFLNYHLLKSPCHKGTDKKKQTSAHPNAIFIIAYVKEPFRVHMREFD